MAARAEEPSGETVAADEAIAEIVSSAEAVPSAETEGHSSDTEGAPAAETYPDAYADDQGRLGFCGEIAGSLIGSFQREMEDMEANWLAAHVRRILMWSVDTQRDLRKGDRIRVLYEFDGTLDGMTILALDFDGAKNGKVQAVRFQPSGEAYPRFFDLEGVEIQKRLRHQPLEEFEQVTDLLGGPRRHKGVDFKAPVGTPVLAPFAGTILRKNFNWRVNGNCLEVEFSGRGVRGLFLHMEKFDAWVRPGAQVQAGQTIGYVGNTGRTTAAAPALPAHAGRESPRPDSLPRDISAQPGWRRVDALPRPNGRTVEGDGRDPLRRLTFLFKQDKMLLVALGPLHGGGHVAACDEVVGLGLLGYLLHARHLLGLITHDAAFAHLALADLELRFDERQNLPAWLDEQCDLGKNEGERDERDVDDDQIGRFGENRRIEVADVGSLK